MPTRQVYQFFVIFQSGTTLTLTVLADSEKAAVSTLSEYLDGLGQGGAYQFTVVRVKGAGLVAPVVEQTEGSAR